MPLNFISSTAFSFQVSTLQSLIIQTKDSSLSSLYDLPMFFPDLNPTTSSLLKLEESNGSAFGTLFCLINALVSSSALQNSVPAYPALAKDLTIADVSHTSRLLVSVIGEDPISS